MVTKARISRKRKAAYLFTALFISVILIRVFFIDSFMVAGNSMAPALIDGDYVFVNKMAYLKQKPARGDIVVGNFRDMDDKKVIKRVIGLPGEWIFIENGTIYIANERHGERESIGQLDSEDFTASLSHNFTYRLDPHEYFLMGDNGLGSIDSRELGPVDVYKIDGRVAYKFRF